MEAFLQIFMLGLVVIWIYLLFKYLSAVEQVTINLGSNKDLSFLGLRIEPKKLALMSTPSFTFSLLFKSFAKSVPENTKLYLALSKARIYLLSLMASMLVIFVIVFLARLLKY